MVQVRKQLQTIVEREETLLVGLQLKVQAFRLHPFHESFGYTIVIVQICGQTQVSLIKPFLLQVRHHHLAKDIGKAKGILRLYPDKMYLRTKQAISLYLLSISSGRVSVNKQYPAELLAGLPHNRR